MAKQVHELEATATRLGSELDPNSSDMQALGQLVWGDSPPFSQQVAPSNAAQMFASEFASPQGMLRMIQRYGQTQALQIEQQLVRQGYLNSPMQGDAAPTGQAFDPSQLGQPSQPGQPPNG